MASVDQIVTRLEDLSADVCSEKVTQRNKAIDQVKQIFDSSVSFRVANISFFFPQLSLKFPLKPTAVQAILTGATASSLTPKYVFSNIFNGLLKVSTAAKK